MYLVDPPDNFFGTQKLKFLDKDIYGYGRSDESSLKNDFSSILGVDEGQIKCFWQELGIGGLKTCHMCIVLSLYFVHVCVSLDR